MKMFKKSKRKQEPKIIKNISLADILKLEDKLNAMDDCSPKMNTAYIQIYDNGDVRLICDYVFTFNEKVEI